MLLSQNSLFLLLSTGKYFTARRNFTLKGSNLEWLRQLKPHITAASNKLKSFAPNKGCVFCTPSLQTTLRKHSISISSKSRRSSHKIDISRWDIAVPKRKTSKHPSASSGTFTSLIYPTFSDVFMSACESSEEKEVLCSLCTNLDLFYYSPYLCQFLL